MSALRALLYAWLLAWAGTAAAHELTMAEVDVRETARGDFLWQWLASGTKPAADELRMVWPAQCRVAASTLRCGERGLTGTLEVEGVGQSYSAVLVKVTWVDGQKRIYTLTKAQRTVRLFGSADDRRGTGEIAAAYSALGVEHILTGFDHLLFVVALLFLVGFGRRLLWTITAFTAAHSLTLGLSALGWLALRRPPVEAAIALSIVLVAAEALHTRQTLSRRWPALVAFLFGLVHGLGFAGALEEIGLPQHHLLVALLTFNLGVEAGQLLVVLLAWGIHRLAKSRPQWLPARVAALYAIGAVASYWSVERMVAIFG
ncbi:MAG: HupE/UreJ family protein [Betaproteobacteria bacterium]